MMEFDLELIQAINDWQIGGVPSVKSKRGQNLQKICSERLDEKYKKCNLVAFRRIALEKKPLWELLANERLDETISAWSLDTDFVKKFKDGVPEPGWQGVICMLSPGVGEIIVNLSLLYSDRDFVTAVERHKHLIRDFDKGINKYGAKQSEVIIRREFIVPNDIYALGGYSGSAEEIGEFIFDRKVTSAEIDWMKLILNKDGEEFGAWWIDGDAKDRVLCKIKETMPSLKELKGKQEQNSQ